MAGTVKRLPVLYICGLLPVNGSDSVRPSRPDIRRFEAASDVLLRLGFRVSSPVMLDLEDDQWSETAYMRRALRLMSASNGVCMLPGWLGSRLARAEYEIADTAGLDVREYQDWLSFGIEARRGGSGAVPE